MIWMVVLALLIVPWSQGAGASSIKTRVPVHAQLSSSSVFTGDWLTFAVKTLKKAHLLLHVTYPGVGGFKKKGTSDASGAWSHTWEVRARAAGRATVQILVQKGSLHRYYTIHFTVLPPTESTATPTLTATPTKRKRPTPTATPTSTIVPTLRTLSSTSTVSPTPTWTPTW